MVDHHDFDARRLEMVVGGLQLFGGAQLAIDTGVTSALEWLDQARSAAASQSFVEERNGRIPS